MLNLISVSHPGEQRAILSSFDPSQTSWVVSDLKSKFDLNDFLLRERNFLHGESVLRASELWRVLLGRVRPDLQIISREFAITLIAHKLSSLELDWARPPGAPQTAYDYMTQLMPILAHPDGEEMVREWLQGHAESAVRWQRWFDLSLRLWREFLAEGFVAPPWISGVLVNEASLSAAWSRPLIVDLGAELSQVEADLLVQMSDWIDISVLVPEPEWRDEYRKTLFAYEILARKLGSTKSKALPESSQSLKTNIIYRKYTTMIAEVKDATAMVRRWLEESVPARQIAIVAPDIEAYWLPLLSYLEQEGIASQKNQVRKLHGYPDMARWFAYLRLRSGAYDEVDVELGLFDSFGKEPRLISYERFKTLYSTIYGRQDIEREKKVAARFHADLKESDEIARDEFVAWGLRQLPEEADFLRVESVYKRLFAECPPALRLSLRRWMAYFEQIASKVECRVQDGDPNGIACINLSSAENSPATHMIVLGLTESGLKQSGGTAILFSDVASLAQEFGFHLASEDQAKLEFEAKWVISRSDRTLVLSVPETDFAGSVQAASWLWIKGAKEAGQMDEISLPRETRWDELQRASLARIAELRGWSLAHRTQAERALSEDLDLAAPEAYGQGLVETLSPSAIEDYLHCPFVFAVKRLFRLTDVAELDLEVDASRRGSLMHKLFEILTEEPMRFDCGDDELSMVVEKAREQSAMELADARLWPPLKSRYLDLAKRFLAFEKENRTLFPETHTVGRELDVAGFLDPRSGELHPQKKENNLRFVGSIDRVDEDRVGHLAIYDYKSSASSVSQYGSWLKNNRIQLLLYAMAIEKGLTALDPRPVLAALYYVSRPFNRDYGFKVEGPEQGLYALGDKRKKNRLSTDEKDQLFTKGEELVSQAAQRILAGDFTPNPRDQKDCMDCQWSVLCRAPHLNS